MIIQDFKTYVEGLDISKISPQNLTYPSKNVIVHKGKISTRGGIVNDGVVPTVQEAIHSEFVWKDALGGQRPIRVHGKTVQVKYNSKWYTIFTALDTATVRVFFASWVDSNGSIIKKRLFMTDGTANLYQWNGAIGTVESATTNSVVLPTADGTCLQQGFDAGNVTAQNILHFIGSNVVANSEEIQTNNPTAQTLLISGTFNTTPVAGDIIMTKPVTIANAVASSFNIDFIINYKNHIVVGNYNSVNLYFSNIETYSLATGLDFSMPASSSRTAVTAIFMQLDGNITSLITRKGILWVSDSDDWYKVTKTIAVNPYGLWVDTEKLETGQNKGALPMAVAKHKGDIVYIAQDSTLQRITTNEILAVDDIRLLSDEVEDLFKRVNLTDVRLYYVERAIYIICPNDSTMLILDMVEGIFQSPQTLPINCMSIIDGIKYGHHNSENQTYKLFSGRDDLGTPIEAVIALGYTHGEGNYAHPLRYKSHTLLGISCRITLNTKVSVDQYFEQDGAKDITNFEIDGSTIKTYNITDTASWATHPYADRSWGGADMIVADLRRAFVFSTFLAVPWFEFSPKLTITGTDNEFHLLAIHINESYAPRKIPNELFIPR